MTPKELETSRNFTGDLSSARLAGFSVSPRRQGACSRTAFSELNGDPAQFSSRAEADSSTPWTASHGTESRMPQAAPSNRAVGQYNTDARGTEQRHPGGSPQHRPPLSSFDPFQRQPQLSTDAGSSLSARQPNGAGVGSSGRDERGGAGKAAPGRPATSHFVLAPSLTQSSGQNSGLATARSGQEQDSRPTASSSGSGAPALPPGRVRRRSFLLLSCTLGQSENAAGA